MKRLTKQEREDIQKGKVRELRRFFYRKKLVIGIDLGTQITGLYGEEFNSQIINPKHPDRNARIFDIHNALKNFLTNVDYLHTVVFMEDYSYGLMHSSLAQVAELAGVVKNLLFSLEIPCLLVAPLTLKKFVLGPKQATPKASHKSRIMVEVLDRWGVKFTDDNACDAYCLYRFGNAFISFIKNPDIKKEWEQKMFLDFIVNRT